MNERGARPLPSVPPQGDGNISPDAPHEPRFVLRVSCMACNRERGMDACLVCARLEQAERRRGRHSPELREVGWGR